MTATWTCKKHNIAGLTDRCPSCWDEFEHRRPATEMSWAERADALRALPEQLTIPFDALHQWIEELAGRPVWTHELGTSGFAALIDEVAAGHPDERNMLASLPWDKPLMLIEPEGGTVIELP